MQRETRITPSEGKRRMGGTTAKQDGPIIAVSAGLVNPGAVGRTVRTP
jgi:hypothetical protein